MGILVTYRAQTLMSKLIRTERGRNEPVTKLPNGSVDIPGSFDNMKVTFQGYTLDTISRYLVSSVLLSEGGSYPTHRTQL